MPSRPSHRPSYRPDPVIGYPVSIKRKQHTGSTGLVNPVLNPPRSVNGMYTPFRADRKNLTNFVVLQRCGAAQVAGRQERRSENVAKWAGMRVAALKRERRGASACSTTNTRPLQGCPAVHHVVPEGSESRYSVSGASRNNNISAHLGNNRLCVALHFVRIVELRVTCVCSARAFLFFSVEKSVRFQCAVATI